MKARYQVELETRIITPVVVEADSESDALDLIADGAGEPGQPWYAEPGKPAIRLLGVANDY
jgi:hypothetical protein